MKWNRELKQHSAALYLECEGVGYRPIQPSQQIVSYLGCYFCQKGANISMFFRIET